MKRIRILDDVPGGLTEYLQQARDDASWEGFGSHGGSSEAKREVMAALSANQHGLCAYCEIDLHPRDCQIEHVVPRSEPLRGAHRALDIVNMLACCQGNTSSSVASDVLGDPARHRLPIKRHLSCGQAKANATDEDLLDPRCFPAQPSLVRVSPDGELEPDQDACSEIGLSVERVERTIKTLRLNVLRLKDQREIYRNRLMKRLERYVDDKDAYRGAAEIELLPDESGVLHRFFTTARSYLGALGEDILGQAPQAWI